MIEQDFKIDFQKRKISYIRKSESATERRRGQHNQKGSGKVYSTNDFYSFLQEIFARPQNMNYEIPIEAGSKTKYSLTNGWVIDEKSMKHLKGGNLMLEARSLEGKKFKVL